MRTLALVAIVLMPAGAALAEPASSQFYHHPAVWLESISGPPETIPAGRIDPEPLALLRNSGQPASLWVYFSLDRNGARMYSTQRLYVNVGHSAAVYWEGPAYLDSPGFYVARDSIRTEVGGASFVTWDFYCSGPGIQEGSSATRERLLPGTIVRGVLRMEENSQSAERGGELLDAAGRKMMALRPGENDVRHLAPGVYFVRTEDNERGSAARKVIIQR